MGGFGYENLVPHGRFPLTERLEWVAAATAEYNPEPYERLAAVLRNSGEDEDAREVLLAKQRRRRETLPVAGKLWGYVQDWAVAYGYRPGRAALWMAVLWAVTSVAFSHAGHPRSTATGIRRGTPRCSRWICCCRSSTSARPASGSCAAAGSGWPRR